MSNVMCHMSPFYKVVEPVVEPSVINRAYPDILNVQNFTQPGFSQKKFTTIFFYFLFKFQKVYFISK